MGYALRECLEECNQEFKYISHSPFSVTHLTQGFLINTLHTVVMHHTFSIANSAILITNCTLNAEGDAGVISTCISIDA